MKRLLIRSPSFVRAAKRFVKSHPDSVENIHEALSLLEEDAANPNLQFTIHH